MTAPITDACVHVFTARGKDAVLRYGTARTEMCVFCGGFRLRNHFGVLMGPTWHAAREYERATSGQGDDND